MSRVSASVERVHEGAGRTTCSRVESMAKQCEMLELGVKTLLSKARGVKT